MPHSTPRPRPLPLAALVMLAACNGNPTDTTEGASETGTDATTGPEPTTGSSTGDPFEGTIAPGTGEPTETTGPSEEPRSCGPEDLPYTGSLCGPAERPCQIVADEVIAADLAPRGSGPALALGVDCQPNVAYNEAVDGNPGHFAARALGGRWTTEDAPAALAGLGLSIDPADPAPLLLAHDGASEAELFRRDGGWKSLAALSGVAAPLARQVAHDRAGRLHAALGGGVDEVGHHVFEGGWTSEVLAASAASGPALAISPVDDRVHAAYFGSASGAWEIFWQVPGEEPELALAYNSSALQALHLLLAVAPGEGAQTDVPHLLAAQLVAGEETQRLVLARRAGAGSWDEHVIETEDPGDPCPEPMDAEQTCAVSYTQVRPLALVASAGGDVRALWTHTQVTGTLTAECVTDPIPVCTWNYEGLDAAPTLMISWPTAGGVESAEISASVPAQGYAGAQIDSAGEIHLALYDGLGEGAGVRYLRLGG